jgi:hypothetical protein
MPSGLMSSLSACALAGRGISRARTSIEEGDSVPEQLGPDPVDSKAVGALVYGEIGRFCRIRSTMLRSNAKTAQYPTITTTMAPTNQKIQELDDRAGGCGRG